MQFTFVEWRSTLKKEGKKTLKAKYHDVKVKKFIKFIKYNIIMK